MSCALGLDASADLGAQLQALQSETEVLAPDVSLSECLMLGLRLSRGFDAETAASRFGAELWTRERRRAADRLIERGQLQSDGGWLCIPPSARLFSDGIISQLV
jgi:coproporphyrinogen III oxidase-like Fe-S oxidoreductase